MKKTNTLSSWCIGFFDYLDFNTVERFLLSIISGLSVSAQNRYGQSHPLAAEQTDHLGNTTKQVAQTTYNEQALL